MAIFTVKSKEITDAEIQRIHSIQTPNVSVPIEPVNFSRVIDVGPVETPVEQEHVFIGELNQSLQERFRERFGGLRARIQSRRFQ